MPTRPQLIAVVAVSLMLGYVCTRALATEPDSAAAANTLDKSLTSQGYVRIPIKRTKSGIYAAEVECGEKKLRLTIDTGAYNTCLDPARSKAAGFEWTPDDPKAVAQGLASECCKLESLRIGPITTGPIKALPFDLTYHNEVDKARGDLPFDGVIGNDILASRAAVLDYANDRLYMQPTGVKPSLREAEVVRKKLGLYGYAPIDLTRNTVGELAANVKAGTASAGTEKPSTVELHLLVDTGAPTTYFDFARTDEKGLHWRSHDEALVPAGSYLDVLLIESLTIGPIQTGRVWGAPWDMTNNNLALTNVGQRSHDGLLGNDVLRKHGAIFDIGGQRIYLLPQQRRPPRDPRD